MCFAGVRVWWHFSSRSTISSLRFACFSLERQELRPKAVKYRWTCRRQYWPVPGAFPTGSGGPELGFLAGGGHTTMEVRNCYVNWITLRYVFFLLKRSFLHLLFNIETSCGVWLWGSRAKIMQKLCALHLAWLRWNTIEIQCCSWKWHVPWWKGIFIKTSKHPCSYIFYK